MYSYYDLLDDINYLAHFGVSTGSIGASVSGALIPYAHVGSSGGKQIIITGAIHAREHVTALLVVKQIYALLNSHARLSGGIYFVPMLNPDGNLLAHSGAAEFAQFSSSLLKINGGADFRLWKANLRGVDLNCNFDANFATGAQNVFTPAPGNYVGQFAFSEPETIALRDFTLKVLPVATISYHALGQQIYYKFYQDEQRSVRDLAFARFVNSFLDYQIMPDECSSAGGYKDWCVQSLKIPALTIEVVSQKFSHPLSDKSINYDMVKNKYLPIKILEYFNGVYKPAD